MKSLCFCPPRWNEVVFIDSLCSYGLSYLFIYENFNGIPKNVEHILDNIAHHVVESGEFFLKISLNGLNVLYFQAFFIQTNCKLK